MKNIFVVIDSDNNKSVVNLEIECNKNHIMMWDDIGGHSEASTEYFNECTQIKDDTMLQAYFKLYDIKGK